MRFLFLTLLTLSLTACASAPDEMSYTPVDPSDSTAFAFINAYINEIEGPPNSRYDYTRIDLNGDGLREALFLFKGPYNYWCGWTGCMMVALKAGDNNFTILDEFTGIRGPLVIGDTQTNGWKDIIVRVSGSNHADKTVTLHFDGDTYPSNPDNQNDMLVQLIEVPGARLFP